MKSERFVIAHFRALNSGWKNPRRMALVTDDSGLRASREVLRALSIAFPEVATNVSEDPGAAIMSEADHAGLENDRRWLQQRLSERTSDHVTWVREWIWRGEVLVFETVTPLGLMAFDLHIPEGGELRLGVSFRSDPSPASLKRLRAALERARFVATPKSKGFWIGEVEFRSDEVRRRADELVILFSAVVAALEDQESAMASLLVEIGESAHALVRNPLKNLRTATEFKELAERLAEFADGRKLLYVPNQGNWGDGLIHRGTLQFFEHFGLPNLQMSRSEVLAWTAGHRQTGAKVTDLVLVSGGGGSWRTANSGNRKFVSQVSAVFEKAVVLPHTFEATAVESPGCEILYFCRDSTLSMKSIPEALPAHDMAFFLQLPSLSAVPGGGTGFFLRKDPERAAQAVHAPGGYDLSLLGNHLSVVTPFFQILAACDRIVTDRMHVGIAGGDAG
ncbi:hypothetical protein [Arthrobacter woluwensis]|uniref:hypothetical protein n=1 Tax=Arthrobacter woluwensis TaxID=156980 RepID=UPI001AAF161B|nr:hypothetical protein [Arthrobacter woluwensis]QTF71880.1 hypothetical protein G8758_07585 [Arthrobacter woluwensis]